MVILHIRDFPAMLYVQNVGVSFTYLAVKEDPTFYEYSEPAPLIYLHIE